MCCRVRSLSGSEPGRSFLSLDHGGSTLPIGEGLVDTVMLGKGLLGEELVGESARFRAETGAPALDLAHSAIASLGRARLRYVEDLQPLEIFPLGQGVFFTRNASGLPGRISRLLSPHELHQVAWLQPLREAVNEIVVGLPVFGA